MVFGCNYFESSFLSLVLFSSVFAQFEFLYQRFACTKGNMRLGKGGNYIAGLNIGAKEKSFLFKVLWLLEESRPRCFSSLFELSRSSLDAFSSETEGLFSFSFSMENSPVF